MKLPSPPRVMDYIRNDFARYHIITWCNTRVIWVTQLEIVSAICELFAKQGIGFALWSPGQDLHAQRAAFEADKVLEE